MINHLFYSTIDQMMWKQIASIRDDGKSISLFLEPLFSGENRIFFLVSF